MTKNDVITGFLSLLLLSLSLFAAAAAVDLQSQNYTNDDMAHAW